MLNNALDLILSSWPMLDCFIYPCHNVDQNDIIFVIVVYNSVEEMSVALDNGVIEGTFLLSSS